MPRRIMISAFASQMVGTGHVRRMIVLAAALRELENIWLAIQTSPLGASILRAGRDTTLFDMVIEAPGCADSAMAEMPQLVATHDCDTVVLDNFHWCAETEAPLREAGARVCVIDDLADRPHLADVLIDPNANRDAGAYTHLVPAGCTLGAGAEYCFLSQPFEVARRFDPVTPEGRLDLDQIFLSVGGGDPHRDLLRLTHMLLDHSPLRVTIACGSHVADAAALRKLSTAQPERVDLMLDSDCVPAQMQASAFAVAAGGTMIWERAALGLPSICLVIADNQMPAAQWMSERGLHWQIDLRDGDKDTDFITLLQNVMQDSPARLRMAHENARLIPYGGAQAAARLILGTGSPRQALLPRSRQDKN